MRATLIPLACAARLVLTAPAVADPYDDCILQHMPTAQTMPPSGPLSAHV
jgi:hypothetical protein